MWFHGSRGIQDSVAHVQFIPDKIDRLHSHPPLPGGKPARRLAEHPISPRHVGNIAAMPDAHSGRLLFMRAHPGLAAALEAAPSRFYERQNGLDLGIGQNPGESRHGALDACYPALLQGDLAAKPGMVEQESVAVMPGMPGCIVRRSLERPVGIGRAPVRLAFEVHAVAARIILRLSRSPSSAESAPAAGPRAAASMAPASTLVMLSAVIGPVDHVAVRVAIRGGSRSIVPAPRSRHRPEGYSRNNVTMGGQSRSIDSASNWIAMNGRNPRKMSVSEICGGATDLR